jgi:aromatic-L-amino-acid decarboxylase
VTSPSSPASRSAPTPTKPAIPPSSLEISVEELQLLARRSGELIARWFEELPERAVCPTHDPAELAALLDEPLPEHETPAAEVLDELARLLPYATAIPSPRYHGLLNPAPTPIGVFAESMAGAINQNVGAWRHGSLGVSIEERAIRWLADLYHLPPEATGTLTSGGTEANLTAAACARHRADPSVRTQGLSGAPLVGYVSREGHFSLDRSFDILGLGSQNLQMIESDAGCRIRVAELRKRIAADREAGLRPFFLVGILGTTSTGAVDPLADLAAVAREEGLWFHVDAAYGGAAALSPKLAPLCAGVELADSITVDPHKWFFVPFSAGAILVRDASVLPDTFAQDPVYIRDLQTEGRKFFREGILGSRRFNALKLWLSLKRYGRVAYAAEIEREVAMTRLLHELLVADGRFIFPHEPVLAITCFRFQPSGTNDEEADATALKVQREIERAGRHWISTTVVQGRRFLRANVNSYFTREEHVRELFEVVLRLLPASHLRDEAGGAP